MPKVKGPLFSANASGTYRGLLEFRASATQSIVTGPRKILAPRSAAQQAQANRFQQAIIGWRALQPSAHQQWASTASSRHLTGYQLYLSEYQAQNISPQNQPTLPP